MSFNTEALSNLQNGGDEPVSSLTFNRHVVEKHLGHISDEKSSIYPHALPTDEAEYPIKGPQDLDSIWLTTNTVPDTIKILLIFAKNDQQYEIITSVSKRLGWIVSEAKNVESAVELFQNQLHDLVIIDRRGSRYFDGDDICRALKKTNCHHHSVIIAYVKKSFFTTTSKEDIATLCLLETGFTRALVESSNENVLINELAGIYASEVQPKAQLAAAHSLYLAVDRCRDMVHVTNHQHVLQFANRVSEKILGYKPEDLLGKNLAEIITYENFVLMDQQLQKGREFEGYMNCKRKANDFIVINCRVIPFSIFGRKPTHYIYVHDTTYLLENMGVAPMVNAGTQHPRGSLHSLRRGSFDVRSIGSDLHRRSSVAKLHNLPLEAPITKIITLLTNAMMETTNPDIAVQIDKAIETLKTTELYVPYIREDDKMSSDPVTSDLIGALISAPQYGRDSRRSSNDSSGRSSIQRALGASHSFGNSRLKMHKNLTGPQEIQELLDKCLDWDFDIFKLEALSGGRPLYVLGMSIMTYHHAAAKLGCDENVMKNWLTIIETNYNSENSYHNSTHAADVLQATASFMKSERLQLIFDPLDEIAALIAAIAHDVDHPGKSSQFLCNAGNKLAILYNDLSVLESHHAALTFKLTLSDDTVNIFKNMEHDDYKIIRQNIIDMILATEMNKHFEHLARFVNVCSGRSGSQDSNSETLSDSVDTTILFLPENVTLTKRMMIKCADVSNPTRPLRSCIEWTRRIAEEYFQQTDDEKKLKLPVVMPLFDRMTCSIPKSQIGFIDYIINDMIEAWDTFIDMPEIVTYMRQNYEKWKEYHEQGISTLQDVEKLQQSAELKIS